MRNARSGEVGTGFPEKSDASKRIEIGIVSIESDLI
jgi:hypothetical protein